jgi:hypothetical protein
MKVISKLERIEEYQEDSPAARRKQAKLFRKFDEFVKLILPEARREIFGENSDKKSGEH